ncbi:Uncharacterised protein [Mycobacterium tuberculosis]|uniref:Uncharacterized protein n=1 Tax=Mycobacterium tuberculosis TaxID=1773 RepID=A0A655AW65_MYCTX|nr:Uncharacterised protein [Mycobacterium tuberculosis]CKT95734.1 Uncharacterised protein [Mycobacterium tuberculosis]CKU08426.1 Uncharacterised protein [Mycobacterium tuberculosis]CKW31468.1 Uncharacterised protein [Mycobacterium tuberculosis]CNV75995.1 Uncharacterised protein [Mycobacterium tuberculosis]
MISSSGRASRARSVNNSIASPCPSGGTRQICSPATAIGSRLVANTLSAGHAPSNATIRAAHPSSKCSQLSSTTSMRRSPIRRTMVSTVERPG